MDQSLFTNEKETVVVSERVLYTASSFAKLSLIYLQEIGILTAKREHTSYRHALDSYLFLIVEDGEGTLRIDGETYVLKKGDCAFIDCRRSYSHTTHPQKLWTLRWIHFDGINLPQIFEKYLSRGGRTVINDIDEDRLLSLRHIHDSLMKTVSQEDYVRDMRINEGIASLLTILMELSWDPDAASVIPSRKDILPIKNYLTENYTKKISLDELADMFFINKFYLTRLFKDQFGVSINTYIAQLKITKAKQLLRFTDLTLEEIAFSCGIDDANYFSRFFKKFEGMSPSCYRTTWRVKEK